MKRLAKLTLVLAALGVMGFLFVRSVQDTRAEPYSISRAYLDNWTLALEPSNAPNAPLMTIRPPR